MKLGKFEILEEIGRGGFGIVYKAKDSSLDRIVALKVLLPEHLGDTNLMDAFKREARHMANISHSNVIQVYEVGEVDDQIFIAMQYCDGGSLEQKIKETNGLPLRDAIRMLYQVGHGLDAGHQIGLIHRDIKPSNILFNASGEAEIGDFGISKAVLSMDQSAGHSFNLFSGSPCYVPPELWQGKEVPTPAADIYSLACVFYEAITGEVLFAGESFVHVLSRHMLEAPVFSEKLPVQLVDVLSVALAKKPEERYQSVADFLADVRKSFVAPAPPPSGDSDLSRGTNERKPQANENPVSGDVSFTQIVRRSKKFTDEANTPNPLESIPSKPQMSPVNPIRTAPSEKELPPVSSFVPFSGRGGANGSIPVNPPNQPDSQSGMYQGGERRPSLEKTPSQIDHTNRIKEPNQNQAERKIKRKPESLLILLLIAFVAIAFIVVGSILINNNIAKVNTVLTLTNLPSPTSGATPTSTQMIALDPSALKFASMGSIVDGTYQSYPAGGSNNPQWSVSGSEAWTPINVDGGKEISLGINAGDNAAEAIDIQTFGDVGVMLSLGAKLQGNSSVFIYGSSNAKLTYTGILEMELQKGTVFLRLESRSEIAQIKVPYQQNGITEYATAKLTGGSMLLHLNGDEVQLWCLKDDCLLEFARESVKTFAVQRRSYFPATGTIEQPLEIMPDYYDDLWAYNLRCNKCMDTYIVPNPTPTPTSTSTLWPTNTWRPTDTPKRPTNTPEPPTATNTRYWTPTPTFTWYPSATFTRVSQNPSPSFTPTNTPQPLTPTPTPIAPTSTRTSIPTPTPSPQQNYSGNLYVKPKNGGTVSGGGYHQAGTLVTISASPNAEWVFHHWDGGYIGSDNPHSFILTGDLVITAYFISN